MPDIGIKALFLFGMTSDTESKIMNPAHPLFVKKSTIQDGLTAVRTLGWCWIALKPSTSKVRNQMNNRIRTIRKF